MSDVTAPPVAPAAPVIDPVAPTSIDAAFGATIEPVAAPVVETPAAPVETVQHPGEIPTLLEEFSKPKEEIKAAEPAPVEPKVEVKADAKPAEAKPVEAAPPVEPVVEPVVETPIEYKFEMPPEFKAAPKDLEDFTGTLREIKATPEIGQKLMDMHTASLKQFAEQYAEQTQQQQLKTFNNYRAELRKEVLADPIIGGAGHQTAMTAIAHARNALISDAKPGTPAYEADAKSFDDFLRITGAGDHPAFLKFAHRASRYIREPVAPTLIAKPTPTNGQKPTNSLYAQKPASA